MFIPSGKVTDAGQQEIQFMQEGDNCWFYATKRLANATGFQLEDPTAQRKMQVMENINSKISLNNFKQNLEKVFMRET